MKNSVFQEKRLWSGCKPNPVLSAKTTRKLLTTVASRTKRYSNYYIIKKEMHIVTFAGSRLEMGQTKPDAQWKGPQGTDSLDGYFSKAKQRGSIKNGFDTVAFF